MNERIVILTRHFPPVVSGGARRPYLLAETLQAMGYEVTVVAPSGPDETPFQLITVPHLGDQKLRHAPADSPTFVDPLLRRFLRRYFAIPDADIRWALRAAKAAGPLRPRDWLITSSPPESVHVAGALLKHRHGCRWLADFRDSWLQSPLRPEIQIGQHVRRGLEQRLARFIASRTDCVSATTPDILSEVFGFGARGPGEAIGHFSEPPGEPIILPADTINIVHTGSFTRSDAAREIAPVLEAFDRANRDDLRLYLIGQLSAREMIQVQQSSRAHQIFCIGICDRKQTMRYQAGADVLLLSAAPLSQHIPGKLAEYVAAGRPIISIGGGAWRGSMPFPTAENIAELASYLSGLTKECPQEAGSILYNTILNTPAMAAAKFVDLMALAAPSEPD